MKMKIHLSIMRKIFLLLGLVLLVSCESSLVKSNRQKYIEFLEGMSDNKEYLEIKSEKFIKGDKTAINLHSYNPDYEDKEMELSKINKFFKVNMHIGFE